MDIPSPEQQLPGLPQAELKSGLFADSAWDFD